MNATPISYALFAMMALFSSGCTMSDLFASKNAGKGTSGVVKEVKTTAYCHSEGSHRKWGSKNAIGGRLQSGKTVSASADWSRYPVGTKFKIKGDDRIYVIDDYGSALVGTDTIDIYKTSMREMRGWGVKRVEIEIVEWGSFEKSLDILEDRQRNRHVRAMVASLRQKQSALAAGGRTGTGTAKRSTIQL